MAQTTRDSYLETEVLTATPQRLRKMLLDAAIRYGNVARDGFRQGNETVAHTALDRCSAIIAELLSGVRPENDLARKISSIYVFLLTQTVEIRRSPSISQLEDLIKVLEVERETWRLVCEQTPERPASEHQSLDLSSNDAQSILSRGVETDRRSESDSSGFQLDA